MDNKFLEIAKKTNRIIDLDEAFKEFPPEEEWHKGKIENVLGEENVEYSYYEIGDIVFVNHYNYKNGKMGNNHFFVLKMYAKIISKINKKMVKMYRNNYQCIENEI